MTDVKNQTREMADKIGEAAAHAKEKVSEAASGARKKFDKAGKSMKSAASQAKNKYGEVREKVGSADYQGMTNDLRSYVRNNPGKAIIIAAGVGFLIGLLLRDSEE